MILNFIWSRFSDVNSRGPYLSWTVGSTRQLIWSLIMSCELVTPQFSMLIYNGNKEICQVSEHLNYQNYTDERSRVVYLPTTVWLLELSICCGAITNTITNGLRLHDQLKMKRGSHYYIGKLGKYDKSAIICNSAVYPQMACLFLVVSGRLTYKTDSSHRIHWKFLRHPEGTVVELKIFVLKINQSESLPSLNLISW